MHLALAGKVKTSLFVAILLLILAAYNPLHASSSDVTLGFQVNGQKISNLTYDNITQTSVTVYWTTDSIADSKIRFMAPDSNYQPLIYTDSIYNSGSVTNHSVSINNLQPATIYKYQVLSGNPYGTAVDSGYFITQSQSSGTTDVYFNHSVDPSVSSGETALGNQNFATLLTGYIENANFSIDITLFEFSYYTNIAKALIDARNRGVKIRFIYNHTPNTPVLDSLVAHGIPVLKRDYDTLHSMHNKFIIFDYRYNNNPANKYLWTGSTNITHPQLHSDRNNVIVVQDESLCAAYTREFEEMWGSHTDYPDTARSRFGNQKVDNVPHIFNVAGTRMEVYFAPSDHVAAFLTGLVSQQATSSLFFCMLKFELPIMEDTLHDIFKDGIKIKGVFDSTNSILPGSAYPRMKGLPVDSSWSPPADVFLDTIPGLIHHKYFITDPEIVDGNKVLSTGSYNWETPAELYNDENSLTIFNARVNNLYFQEFHARYRESGGEAISNGTPELPDQPRIAIKAFPNPLKTFTKFAYDLFADEYVILGLYDVNGRLLEILANEKQDKGPHLINWNAGAYPNGIYICRLYSSKGCVSSCQVIIQNFE